MKKCLLIICFIAFAVSAFTQSAKRITPVDVRSIGMGASYYTDTDTFYSLYTNPAALSFVGDRFLFPPLVSAVTGGDTFKAAELSDLITEGSSVTGGDLDDYTNFYNNVNDFIGKNGYNASIKIGGPLTFGSIKNNFGWGFVNTIEIGAKLNLDENLINFDIPESLEDINDLVNSGNLNDIPNLKPELTIPMALTVDFNTDIVLGYAVPLDFGILGTLSVGTSVRGISSVSMLYKNDLQTLYKSLDNFDYLGIPVSASLGVGFDLGVQYQLFEMINVALVWQDAFSPVWTKTYAGINEILDEDDILEGFSYGVLEPQLGLGASVDIVPLEVLTGNIISNAVVYANYKDFLQLVDKTQAGELYRDPLLDLAIGAEVELFEILALRVGMNQLFPSGGVGLNIGNLKIDFSVHNEELGHIEQDWKQLNFGLAVTFQK